MVDQGVASGGLDEAAAETPLAPASPRRLLARLAERLEVERDRWFLWLPVLYGAGVALYFALAEEPLVLVALAPVPVALVFRLVFRRGTLVVAATGIAMALALGFAAAKLRTEFVRAPVLERQLNLVEVRGFIELVEPRAGRGQRLTLRVIAIRGLTPEKLPERVRIRTMQARADLVPGAAVRIRATLGPPARPALPGDYDFARAAFFQQLGGVGYALTRPEPDLNAGEPPLTLRVQAAITGVRQAISQRVRAGLAGERGAIADALITGERGGITDATNAAYRDSGLFHILSISGLHMTIMAGAVFFVVRLLLASVPAIALRFPIKKWAAVIATLAAFGYLLISGSSFATVRSWVMISIMFLAVLLDRPAVALRNVAVSALVIMLVLPDSVFDVGFQMSYAAVVALVSAFEAIRERRNERGGDARLGSVLTTLLFFGGIVLTTLIASFAVAPFAAYHFHKSQQYAVLANLIAIPVCNIVVMPAALVTMVAMPLGLEQPALWVMGLGIDAMTWCAYAVARLPGAVGRLPAIPTLAFALMVGGGLWLCIWRTRWRLLGIAGIAMGLAVAPFQPRPDVLVSGDGQLVAVRNSAGVLAALAGRGASFDLSRWLEHDGDGRPAREVAKSAGFRCDASGCVTSANGVVVAVARHPAALADDCARAGLLILMMPRPPACVGHGPVIDMFDLRDNGSHAIYLAGVGRGDGGSGQASTGLSAAGLLERGLALLGMAHPGLIRLAAGLGSSTGGRPSAGMSIVTVADLRGHRPWTGRAGRPVLAAWQTAGRGSRLALFAAPFDLTDDELRPRPEIEDDDDDADWRR